MEKPSCWDQSSPETRAPFSSAILVSSVPGSGVAIPNWQNSALRLYAYSIVFSTVSRVSHGKPMMKQLWTSMPASFVHLVALEMSSTLPFFFMLSRISWLALSHP